MAQGRLGRYHAGRELRVRGAELAELMRGAAGPAGNKKELSPEEEADLYLERRRAKAAKRG
jgi:hypothetical protein